jgi:hypothetical protein
MNKFNIIISSSDDDIGIGSLLVFKDVSQENIRFNPDDENGSWCVHIYSEKLKSYIKYFGYDLLFLDEPDLDPYYIFRSE